MPGHSGSKGSHTGEHLSRSASTAGSDSESRRKSSGSLGASTQSTALLTWLISAYAVQCDAVRGCSSDWLEEIRC